MFCPNCGTPNDDNSRFCSECGIEIKQISINQQNQQSSDTTMPDQNESISVNPKQTKPKVNKKKIIIIAIVAAIVITVGIIATILIVKAVKKADQQDKLDSYLVFLNDYCEKQFSSNYKIEVKKSTVYVYVWEPEIASTIAKGKSGKQKVKEKYEVPALKIYSQMMYYGFKGGVCMYLFNDSKCKYEEKLMMWLNGNYHEPDDFN